jgi:GNAT superfamily N-acetyltransferase
MSAWTDDELLAEVSTSSYGAHLVRPDTRIVQRPDWYQVITPSANHNTLNEIVFSALDVDRCDAVIDETIALYRSYGVPFKWCVWPGTRPTDMGERLERRGFSRWNARGMTCDPARLSVATPDPSIEIREVDSLDDVDVYADVMARGWELDATQARTDLRADFTSGRGHRRCFLALRDGVPSACAAYILRERSGYLMGAVVLPAHRGAGIYRQLIRVRLEDMVRRGLDLATTLAREETSAPMLERMGFRSVCPLIVYAS